MADKNELLAQLAEARDSYKDFVAAVDADLERERQRRLAERQGKIINLIVEAYVAGASKADLKRAYRTKDHKTIVKILESMSEQIAVVAKEKPAAVTSEPKWEVGLVSLAGSFGPAIILRYENSTYKMVPLDDEEFMLDHLEGDNELYADGEILDRHSKGLLGEIYATVLAVARDA